MITVESLKTLKQPEVAALLDGVDVRTVRRWEDRGLPGHGEGKGRYYIWAEVREWEKGLLPARDTPEGELTDRQRRERADADMAEMARDKAAGNLLDAREVRREWIGFLGRLKDNLLGLADRCAPEIEANMTLAERITVMRRHVNGSLRDVVAELQREAGG